MQVSSIAGTMIGSASAPSTTSNYDPDKLKRKRQPRNSACQGCAALKMKCIPGSQGRCERCQRMDRECIPAVPKPRKRRVQSSSEADLPTSRQLPFYDLTSQANTLDAPAIPPTHSLHPRTQPPASPAHVSRPAIIAHQSHHIDKDTLLARHDISYNGSKSFSALLSQGLGNLPVLDELLRGVDYSFVANAFTTFRHLSRHFPFLEIPPGVDVISMVVRRPLLTVAVCTVTSAARPDTQSRLSEAFRHALSAKLFHSGERGMDLLTSLLVYMAWHHHYFTHSQIYQLLYLLAGMTSDLGLYQPRREPLDIASALERDRAFVGAFCLVSGLSAVGFEKPNPLRWTEHLRQCADNVAATGSLPSDRMLVPILELYHTMDELEESLLQSATGIHPKPTTRHFVELHIKSATHRLKALKREHPSLAGYLGYNAATIHLYHRLYQSTDTPDPSTLIQGACAIKEYLDDIRARPPSTLHQLAIVDWTVLLEILLLTTRIARPHSTPGTSHTSNHGNSGGAAAGAATSAHASSNAMAWESGALSSMLQPDAVLDALCAHMAAAPFDDPLAPRHDRLLRWFGETAANLKRRLAGDGGAAVSGKAGGYGVVPAMGGGGGAFAGAGDGGGGGGSAGKSADGSFVPYGLLDAQFWESLAVAR